MENENKKKEMTDEEIFELFNKARMEKLNVERPEMYVKKELIQVLISAVILAAYFHFAGMNSGKTENVMYIIMVVIGVVLFLFFQIKNILIIMIYLYQKFAPSYIRAACVFKPCCSEYMRLSIVKYGVFRGVFNGIKRIRRCHAPNGGIDEP